MTDTYDAQIEALLADDFETFSALVGRDADRAPIKSHRGAWVETGAYDASLFSILPDIEQCASQVEFEGPYNERAAKYLELFDIGNNTRLPDISASGRFTREQLNEFARRQRLAREMAAE